MEASKHYKEALSAYKSAKSLKELLPNIDPSFTNSLFQKKHVNILNSWKEVKIEVIDTVEGIEAQCHREKYYTLSPHKLSRQVSIYLNGKVAQLMRGLGYKVHEATRLEIRRQWNKEYLNWDYEQMEIKHLFIKISNTVFEKACKTGKLLPKGKYLDENGNVVELKKGRSKGCSNEHLSKSISLFNHVTHEVLSFSSLADAAKHFDVDKGNLSKKLKGLVIGDSVTIKKMKYTLTTS